MLRRTLFSFIIFLLFITKVNAQNDSIVLVELRPEASADRTMGQKFLYDIGNVFGGMGYAYSRPVHWQGKQWKEFAATMAGTALLFLVDEPVNDFMQDAEDDIPQFIQDYGWYYGSPQNNYAMTGGIYLTGLFLDNEKLRRTGVLLISSASAAGLLQQTSKYVFGRARPRSGDSNTTFKPFEADKDYHSFPSGHMILAFTNAYAISKQFKNPWVKGGIIAVGSIPGISRLWEGAHWFSDIALSTVISIAIVESIDRYLDRKYAEKYNAGEKNVSWNLNFSANKIGLIIEF